MWGVREVVRCSVTKHRGNDSKNKREWFLKSKKQFLQTTNVRTECVHLFTRLFICSFSKGSWASTLHQTGCRVGKQMDEQYWDLTLGEVMGWTSDHACS